jgi:hypothetical protein
MALRRVVLILDHTMQGVVTLAGNGNAALELLCAA